MSIINYDQPIDLSFPLVNIVNNEILPTLYPNQEELSKAIIKAEEGSKEQDRVDETKLKRETVKTALLTCLMRYESEDVSEGKRLRELASIITEADKKEIKVVMAKPLVKDFIVVLLKASAKIKRDGKVSGLYPTWIIDQIAEQCGIAF